MVRREIEGKRFLEIVLIVTISFFFIYSVDVSCQELPDFIIGEIEEMASQGNESIEEIYEYYYYILNNPLKINLLSLEELENSPIFNRFQAYSIVEYREKFGEIVSLSELKLLMGFHEEFVEQIAPFITFDLSGNIGEKSGKKGMSGDISLRSKYKSGAKSPYLYASSLLNYNDRIGFELVGESDMDEPLTKYYMPDFLSANLSYSSSGTLKKLILGDYRASFGQGLVLNKSFSINSFSSSNFYKRRNSISPYHSTNEYNFLRGVAATLGSDKFDFNLIFSANSVDATLKDGAYTSIVTTGLHNTELLLSRRRNMREYLVAANATYSGDFYTIGCTSAFYRYDKECGKIAKEYNKYQIYNGLWGNISLSGTISLGTLRYYGEIAIDRGLSPALLLGLIWNPIYELEGAFQLRSYSKSYIATHSSAYSTLSSTSNQQGFNILIKWLTSRNNSLSFSGDCVYYPHSRYRVDDSSSNLKFAVEEIYTKDDLKISSKISYNYSSNDNCSKINGNISSKYLIFNKLYGETKAVSNYLTTSDYGCGISQALLLKMDKYEIHTSATYFFTTDWASRVYLYQRDTPGSFSIPAYSGEGYGVNLFCKYKIDSSISLWLRFYYLNNFASDKDDKYEAKIELRYTL